MNDKLRILIADDEAELLDKLVTYIGIFCDTIYKACDGQEALKLYEEHKPDIILTDINMPKINGLELIETIRKTDQKTKIIILTAYTDTEYLLKAIKLHLVSYLLKPVKIDELRHTITKAIGDIEQDSYILLNNGYKWDDKLKLLLDEYNKKIELSGYEILLIGCLVRNLNKSVSYEDIHNYIYELEDFSKDALSSLVKRIRQKTKKDFITSCYKVGYKIEV